MSKGNSFEALAREAVANVEAARAAGEQLSFLPDEAQRDGRKPRGAGKATSQMRDWLASKGFRLPEDVLAEMAGLAGSDDAFMAAMKRAEQVLAWARASSSGDKAEPSMAARIETFKFVFTAQLRAAEALAPYGLAKLTPDVAVQQSVPVVFAPGATAAPGQKAGDGARDVTPQARRIAPPPMPREMKQNQGLAKDDVDTSDGDIRTQEVRR